VAAGAALVVLAAALYPTVSKFEAGSTSRDFLDELIVKVRGNDVVVEKPVDILM
jgi:hypothetical protein